MKTKTTYLFIIFYIYIIFSEKKTFAQLNEQNDKKKWQGKLRYSLEYLYNKPFLGWNLSEHHFFGALSYKNKIKIKVFYGIPMRVSKPSYTMRNTYLTGGGINYTLTKDNKRFDAAITLEYFLAMYTTELSTSDTFKLINKGLTIGILLSYKLDSNKKLIFEPFNCGFGSITQESIKGNQVSRNVRYPNILVSRIAAIGFLVEF